MPYNKSKSTLVKAVIPKEQNEKLERKAKEMGLAKSTCIRVALAEFLKEE